MHQWRSQYRAMKADEAKRLKELEIANTRLERPVADQTMDMTILQEAISYLGKHERPRERGAS